MKEHQREDDSRLRASNTPRAMATFRNPVTGAIDLAKATRHNGHDRTRPPLFTGIIP